MPVYVALGNNDSDCGDYQWMRTAVFEGGGRRGGWDASAEDEAGRRRSLCGGADYSAYVRMPMKRTRMIVLDDLFMAAKYKACGGKADASGG